MKLDARLKAVAKFVEQVKGDAKEWTHIDIGSDHGHLLKVLFEQKLITKAIAIEKNDAPLKRTQKALRGHQADCFLGNGFAPLEQNNANSASICGLGANTILQILEAHPEKLPNIIILQANKQSEKLRQWGYENSYHLINEYMVEGFWKYAILLFEKKHGVDIVYTKLPTEFSLQLQFKYGPHLLRRRNLLLLETIKSEYEHFKKMDASNKEITTHISDLKLLLDHFL